MSQPPSPDTLARVRAALARRPRGVVADIDGTLAPIAPTPRRARVSAGCRAALRALQPKLDVLAFISGRAATEAAAMVGVPGALYIGNHGLDWATGDPSGGRTGVVAAALPYVAVVRDTLAELKGILYLPGVVFENKGPTASIHYRRCAEPEAARAAILAAIAASPAAGALRVGEGKMVIELRPPLDLDKGTALRQILDYNALRSAVYIGDDMTDVDAFRALAAWATSVASGDRSEGDDRSGLAIAVVGADPSNGRTPEVMAAADLTIAGVAEVERLLAELGASLRL